MSYCPATIPRPSANYYHLLRRPQASQCIGIASSPSCVDTNSRIPSQNCNVYLAPGMSETIKTSDVARPPPTTPTRKRGGGNKHAPARKSLATQVYNADRMDDIGIQSPELRKASNDDFNTLFKLLGVDEHQTQIRDGQAQQPGSPRDGVDIVNGRQSKRIEKRLQATSDTPSQHKVINCDSGIDAVTTPISTRTRRRGKRHDPETSLGGKNLDGPGKRNVKSSKLSIEHSVEPVTNLGLASSTSRSLPGNGFFTAAIVTDSPVSSPSSKAGSSRQKKDEVDVWDMPINASGIHELTWQQKLDEGTALKGKKPRSAPTEQRGSQSRQPNKAKTSNHERRMSLDHLPALLKQPAFASSMRTAPPSNYGGGVSVVDDIVPFRTGFNVHRAPQTPIRPGASRGSPLAVSHHDDSHSVTPGVIPHPLVGDSHVNKAGGARYAGPAFHNSPHGTSWPKPDLEDF